MPQTTEQIDQDKIKEAIQYLQTGLTIQPRDFETIQNIEDEEKTELIKSITNSSEGQIVNNKIAISDYTRDDNNIGIPIMLDLTLIILLKILLIILLKPIMTNQLILLTLK